MSNTNVDDVSELLAPLPDDALDVKDDLLDGLAPDGFLQIMLFDSMIRDATRVRRFQIIEKVQLSQAADKVNEKLAGASEPLDSRLLHALALKSAMSNKSFATWLRMQSSSRRWFGNHLRMMRDFGEVFPPQSMQSCKLPVPPPVVQPR